MLNLSQLIKLKDLTDFFVWFFKEHSFGEKNNDLIYSALCTGEGKDMPESNKEEIIDLSYFVNGVQISNYDLLSHYLFSLELKGHGGYPGGEKDKTLARCGLCFEPLSFMILYSEYISAVHSKVYVKEKFSDDE